MSGRTDFYVYLLIDPRDGQPFYIGKGTGKRVHQHEASARRGRPGNSRCLQRIHEIWRTGGQVLREIVADGLCEPDAFKRERLEIERVGITNLTNVAPGTLTDDERGRREASAYLASIPPGAFAGSQLLQRIERELQAIALGLIPARPTVTVWVGNGCAVVVNP